MKTVTIPKDVNELKSFILNTVCEISERFVPYVSFDEQEELEKIYGKDLFLDDYNKNNIVKL